MTIKLYGTPLSRTMRPMWALEELGLPYEIALVNIRKGDQKQPAYLALNPMGKVPMLVDGDVRMTESLAITLYIAQRHGMGKLWPTGEAAHAALLQWSFWAATELEPVTLAMLKAVGDRPAAERDPKLAAERAAPLQPLLDYLDLMLGRAPYLAGDAFTLADLQVTCVLDYASPRSGFDLAPWPKVAAWHAVCHDRPAYRKVQDLRTAAAEAQG